MINLFSINRAGAIKKERIAATIKFVSANRISTIPSMLAKINELARNPDASASDYARVCEMDQSSCVKVLMLANSAAYGTHTGNVIRNVQQAVIRIGVRKTREVINSTVVSPLFKSGKAFSDYSPNALWLNSIAVAVSNRLLYQLTGREEPADADPYLAGLLHNFAIPLEHLCFLEDGFQAAVNARSLNQSVLADEEIRHLGVSHNEIGAALAEHWHFPHKIRNVIQHHHDHHLPDGLADVEMLHITRASQWLCQELKLGYAEFPESLSDMYLGSFNALSISADTYAEASQKLSTEIQRLQQLGWFSGLRVNSH
jgi:HD-like signal output (HDOD) protein